MKRFKFWWMIPKGMRPGVGDFSALDSTAASAFSLPHGWLFSTSQRVGVFATAKKPLDFFLSLCYTVITKGKEIVSKWKKNTLCCFCGMSGMGSKEKNTRIFLRACSPLTQGHLPKGVGSLPLGGVFIIAFM